MVINETLRLFPPVGISFRQCTKDYKMPNGCILKKGTEVQVQYISLHTYTEFCIPTEQRLNFVLECQCCCCEHPMKLL